MHYLSLIICEVIWILICKDLGYQVDSQNEHYKSLIALPERFVKKKNAMKDSNVSNSLFMTIGWL